MNIIAIFHAYQFTHFGNAEKKRTADPDRLTTTGTLKTLVFGINNPRPVNSKLPAGSFQTVVLESNKKIECWYIAEANPNGTVIIFHGYGGNKSSMLDKSDEFLNLGYNTLLVDFMGSGGSEGRQTTIGFF